MLGTCNWCEGATDKEASSLCVYDGVGVYLMEAKLDS